MYARYKFVEKLSEETRVVSPRLNKTALMFGMISCLGMCIVATFQVCFHMYSSAHINHMKIIECDVLCHIFLLSDCRKQQ